MCFGFCFSKRKKKSPAMVSSSSLSTSLLPPASNKKKTLILDLDETLVHSSFKQLLNCDFTLNITIDGISHVIYVMKRPGVDNFLQVLSKYYEITVFTASMSNYADPLLDLLDIHKVIKHRLYREDCIYRDGNYIKDLDKLGRDLGSVLILDNSPLSYSLHESNAVAISSWFSDPFDTELTDLIQYFITLSTLDDVRSKA